MRERIELALGRWGRFVYRRAGWVIALCLLATAGFATQIQHLTLDASTEGFFHADDPIRVRYDAFRDAYGRESFIVIGLVPNAGVFDPGFLEQLRALHREIENDVPYVAEVTSLVNARETRGFADRLEVGDFLEDWPETPEALADVEARARSNRLYRNLLLSADGEVTTVVIETDVYKPGADPSDFGGFDDETEDRDTANPDAHPYFGGEYDEELTAALEPVLERYRSDDLEIFLAGTPTFTTALARKLQTDMPRFTGLCFLLVAGFLAALFRRVGAVVLPLVVVALTAVSTLSLMAATDTPVMPPTQIIPSFLMAVGVGGAVHLLAIFYQAQRRGEDVEGAIAFALSHSGLPIIMTCLTTAGGLLSFVPAALRPISHFGFFTPVGVLVSLFFTLTLLPAMIAVFPMRAAEARREDTASQRLLLRVGAACTGRPGAVIAIWAAILAVAGVGVSRLTLNHDMLEWFPEGDPNHTATHFINDRLGGSVSMELLIDTGRENGFHEPELLKRIDRVQEELAGIRVGNVSSAKSLALTDVVKETHRALNENREAFYAIPDERTLVAQELLLFENAGSDDVEDFVDPQFASGRITVRLPFTDGAAYDPYLAVVMPRIETILGPDVDLELTGMLRLLANTVTAALHTLVLSYVTAFLVITVLMVLLIGRVRLGLVAMIPNLSPIVATLGLMGWIGIPLDMFTLMIGTVALGLAVDDTIHFMHNFRRYYDQTGDPHVAVRETLRGTGQALLFTSLVLASGFLVYTQGYMMPMIAFGLLTATAVSLAFVADVTLAPALVTTLAHRKSGTEPR